MLELNYPLRYVRQAMKKGKKAKMHKQTRSEALGSSTFSGIHLRTDSHRMWAKVFISFSSNHICGISEVPEAFIWNYFLLCLTLLFYMLANAIKLKATCCQSSNESAANGATVFNKFSNHINAFLPIPSSERKHMINTTLRYFHITDYYV